MIPLLMCPETQSEVKCDDLAPPFLMFIRAIFMIKFKHLIINKRLKIIIKRYETVLDEIPFRNPNITSPEIQFFAVVFLVC